MIILLVPRKTENERGADSIIMKREQLLTFDFFFSFKYWLSIYVHAFANTCVIVSSFLYYWFLRQLNIMIHITFFFYKIYFGYLTMIKYTSYFKSCIVFDSKAYVSFGQFSASKYLVLF